MTGEPIQGATITQTESQRPASLLHTGPLVSAKSNAKGKFNLPPTMHSQIRFMYMPNPIWTRGTFDITAAGYHRRTVSGVADSSSNWRVQTGLILLWSTNVVADPRLMADMDH